MDPLLQRTEGLARTVAVDHDLAVEHVAPGRERELREVAGEVLCAARLERQLLALDERDRAKSVVLLLVTPLRPDRQRGGGTRELGLDSETHRRSA